MRVQSFIKAIRKKRTPAPFSRLLMLSIAAGCNIDALHFTDIEIDCANDGGNLEKVLSFLQSNHHVYYFCQACTMLAQRRLEMNT